MCACRVTLHVCTNEATANIIYKSRSMSLQGESMAKPPLKHPNIVLTKHPDFKVVHVDGAWILLKGDEGFMKFYLDIVEPEIKASGRYGAMEIDKIDREFQVEVRMSIVTFMKIAGQIEAHIKQLEKKGIVTREKKKRKKETTYRV